MSGPLNGLRVVDCTRGTAGPRATGLLADHGAAVVRIEPPGGDPWQESLRTSYSVFNRGKEVRQLDLKAAAGRAELQALLGEADVFVESWRPGVAHRLGLDRDTLHLKHPSLICGSITGFGTDGPRRGVRGYESTVHALLGTTAEQLGFRDGPIFEGVPFAASGAACLLDIGVLAAVYRRCDDGVGRRVEVSLVDGAVAFHAMLWRDSAARPQQEKAKADDLAPAGSTQRLICGSFRTSDDRYIGVHTGAVGAFGRLMEVLGIADEIPSSPDGKDLGIPLTEAQQHLLHTRIHEVFAQEPLDVWVDRLLAVDVCGIAQHPSGAAFDDEQIRANGLVVEAVDPVLGRIEQVGPPIRFGEARAAGDGRWPMPTPGTPDTRPLLAGVHILDAGAFYAGPYAARLLADLGAEVVKLEGLGGDPMRGLTGLFRSCQASKRSVALDLKAPEAAPALSALLAWADILCHNMRPGVADRIGLGRDAARAVNPDLVYCHSPGWGSVGPYAQRQSFEPMMSGFVGAGFEVAGLYNPPIYPLGNADPGNGLLGAVAMLIGLVHRRRTGEALDAEMPLLNAAMAQVPHVVRQVESGAVVGAGRLDPFQTGFGPLDRLYETSDGWLSVTATSADELATIGERVGLPDLVARAQDATDPESHASYVLGVELGDLLATRTTEDWLAAFAGTDVAVVAPAGNGNLPFLGDDRNVASRRVVECVGPDGAMVRELGVLVSVSDADVPEHVVSPALGQHTLAVLRERGLDDASLQALVGAGVLHQA